MFAFSYIRIIITKVGIFEYENEYLYNKIEIIHGIGFYGGLITQILINHSDLSAQRPIMFTRFPCQFCPQT